MAISLIFYYVCLLYMGLIPNTIDSYQAEDPHCDSNCDDDVSAPRSPGYLRGRRYTYRYTTTVASTLHSSHPAGRSGMALDCVVDVDVVGRCQLAMQIRNPLIKRLSAQKEHSVQRLKSLREALERSPLKFSLQAGKVTSLCAQEGEQVWTLNLKRALLSMLQTSRTVTKQETVKESDVYGTCKSFYERRGSVLLKTRDLTQCQRHRLADFWPHSTSLTEDTMVDSNLQCTQRLGTVMEEVNCVENISVATLSGTAGGMKTQTVSNLILLRTQPGTPTGLDALAAGVQKDLQFEVEGTEPAAHGRGALPREAADTVRSLCSLTNDPHQTSGHFLHLAFQLRALSLPQLKKLWQEASFKCRNEWQPLLDALPACGTEACHLLLSGLVQAEELEEDRAFSYLTSLSLTSHPTPKILGSINALLEKPALRAKALLAGSSLVHLVCQRARPPCGSLPQVKAFVQALEDTLRGGCGSGEPGELTEVLHALKAVGNAGQPAVGLAPLLTRCARGHTAALELRLAAIQAFRRMPCTLHRGVMVQLYGSAREEPEVRIAAYQQLMRCPEPEFLLLVKSTLSNETSSQVGSFVWSHLTNILRTEDPMKLALMEALPDDIISKDFEAEPWKYSFYSDYTVDSGSGVANMEGALVFSPKSFVPSSAMTNLTVYAHGRAVNLLEVDLRLEGMEPLLKDMFGHQSTSSNAEPSSPDRQEKRRGREEDGESTGGRDGCSPSMQSYLNQARNMFSGRKGGGRARGPRCRVGVKVFGNELSLLTCADLYTQANQLSLTMAGVAVKLLKGQEVELSHRAVLITEELVLPSLSGLPFRLAVNMTSLLSVNIKGGANYRSLSHFSLAGYIKPNAYVGLWARVGVDGALGRAAVEWTSELRTSSSLDGSIHLQEGRDLRVTLNTPEDLVEVVYLGSRVFHLSGDHRDEIKGPKSRTEKTTCTPKAWSKVVGWQLCSNVSYPLSPVGISLPPPGPVHLSLRLLKLDRGLNHYLLEAAYTLLLQKGRWLPQEASLHLLLATPQSSIPRDMSLDLALNPQRLLFKISHPLKTIHIHGQLGHERSIQTGRLELLIDNVYLYYIMGLIDTQNLQSEQRQRYHLEAKMAADGRPMVLSANITRGLGRKTSLSATLKNVFKETASFSVAFERSLEDKHRQYSVEAELLLAGVIDSRLLGLLKQQGPSWSCTGRLKYGLGENARHQHQECYMSQNLRRKMKPDFTYNMEADHQFHCSHAAVISHKIQLRHEESPSHIKSSLDVSYGQHWDEIDNKHRLHLSQSFKNQSRPNHTSYALEFSLQVPEKHLNYKSQLLHSYLREAGTESSTHLKVTNQEEMPFVAGLHWKDTSKASFGKWEGTFNMDTPWLYIHTAHKLRQPQRRALQLTSELTARKWLIVRSLVLEGLLRDRGRRKEARLHLHTPTVTYLKVGGWTMHGKKGVKASCTLISVWGPTLRGDLALDSSKHSRGLQLASSVGKHNLSLSAAVSTSEKDLKRRQVVMKVVLSEPKSPPMELVLEGAVEELRRHRRMYQKRAMLRLKQPFQRFLQSLLVQETFTVDLLKGLYILESRVSLFGSADIAHTLTLGYRSPSPFVCSALTHPFSSGTIPPDSEVCVTVTSKKGHRELQGRLRVGTKDKLTFHGNVQMLQPSGDVMQHWVRARANFTNLLPQLQLPSSAVLEGEVSWSPSDNAASEYLARGRVGIERQECQFSVRLNGSEDGVVLHSFLSHPFKSKLPKTLEAQAAAHMGPSGGRGLVCLKSDGKDRGLLKARLSYRLAPGTRTVGLRMNMTQSLLTTASDLGLDVTANISTDSFIMQGSYTQNGEAVLARLRGQLEHTPRLQVAVSGDLSHSLASLRALSPALGLDGVLGHSHTLTEGHLRVFVQEAVYSVELRRQEDPETLGGEPGLGDTLAEEHRGTLVWLCVRVGEESLCLNVSHSLGGGGRDGVNGQLSHSCPWLHATVGIPGNNSVELRWEKEEGRLSGLAHLKAGLHILEAEFDGVRTGQANPKWRFASMLQHQSEALALRGLPTSVQATGHYKGEPDGMCAGLDLHVEEQKKLTFLIHKGVTNSTASLAVSLRQQLALLKGLIPSSFKMNCTGDWSADRLSAQCSGGVDSRPLETSRLPPQFFINGSLLHHGCSTQLDTYLRASGEELAALSLAVSCHPHLSLRGSGRHSLEGLRVWGVPDHTALLLAGSSGEGPWGELGLELGKCLLKAEARGRKTLEAKSSYDVNITHYCAALKRWGLPVNTSVEASLAGGPGESGTLLIKAGPCQVTVKGDVGANGRTRWFWGSESHCPFSRALGLPSQSLHNVSVVHHAHGEWEAAVGSGLEGERVSLRLRARGPGAGSGLRLEVELDHHLASLEAWPQRSRLLVTGSAAARGYRSEAELQLGGCVARATGSVVAGDRLQGAVVYRSNCTTLQEMGCPSSMEASGWLVVTKRLVGSQLVLVMDGEEMHAGLVVNNTEVKQEMSARFHHSVSRMKRAGLPVHAAMSMHSDIHGNGSYHQLLHCRVGKEQLCHEVKVEKTPVTVSFHSHFNHTVSLLRSWGVAANNSAQVEVVSRERTALTFLSQLGSQRAGFVLHAAALPRSTELRGALWHSSSWLQHQGLPLHSEAVCLVQGTLSQLRSSARLTLDGHQLLVSGVNVSLADGRLALLLSVRPAATQRSGGPVGLDAMWTAQLAGPVRSVSLDVRCGGGTLRLVGEVRGWGTRGSREAKVTLQHSVLGLSSPVLQVEAWGRLTDSQLRCSMALNPELSASMALIVQGHRLPNSQEVMVKVVQNIPQLLLYLPSQLSARSQVNVSGSSAGGVLELSSDRRRLWALGELAVTDGGFRQALELNHTCPQLKPWPRSLAVRTVFQRGPWSYQLQQEVVSGAQEVRLAGLYSVPPHLDLGNHTLKVQIASVPRGSGLEVTLERSLQSRLDRVLLGWTRHKRLEQVKAQSWRTVSGGQSETGVLLVQPFSATLSQLSLRTLSLSSPTQRTHQTHVYWDSGGPGNVSISLYKQWQDRASRGQACAFFTSTQKGVPSMLDFEGCVSVAQEGNSFSQNAELKWGNSSVRQGMKYQRSLEGMHTFQLDGGMDRVSPAPCPSHSLLAQVHTNLRDRLEHTLLLDLCPPRPSLSWSGHHRLSRLGAALLHSQNLVALSGQPAHCSLTLALTNSSSLHHTNISLSAKSVLGNWSVEVAGSALSSPLGRGLHIQAQMDRSEQVWLKGALEGPCVRTTAGYGNVKGTDEQLGLAVCAEARRRLTLEVLKQEGVAEPITLALVSVGSANHSLTIRARGCTENLREVEARVQLLNSQLASKLLGRVQTLQALLTHFRHQSRDSHVLQDLSTGPLKLTQRLEAVLGQRDGGLWALWRHGSLRHGLTHSLPRGLGLLQHASLMAQQELKRPLATLAGAYQDVSGQRLEAEWGETVALWSRRLVEVLPLLLENPQLRPLVQNTVTALTTALDLVGQQTFHWADAKLAAGLSGVRRTLASVYKLSPSECAMLLEVALPLSQSPWSRVGEVGVVAVVLEQWLIRPLQSLASFQLRAELYGLKRRLMDSPFTHQALVVGDQFVVTFDGHLYQLPPTCLLLLAQDVRQGSFTLLLNVDSPSQRSLVVGMNNSTVTIRHDGQVEADCHVHGSHTPFSGDGVVVKRDSNRVMVSNQDGVSVECDPHLHLCSVTMDGWLHGTSTGLLGINDNEAGNDISIPDGSQPRNMNDLVHSWQMKPECVRSTHSAEACPKMVATDSVSCDSLFSASDSPLGSCFKVVVPVQFLSLCESSGCGPGPSRTLCGLAAAYVQMCQRNYVPLELPVQCLSL